MPATTLHQVPANLPAHPHHVSAAVDGISRRLRNIEAFEAGALAGIMAAHPGLRHERKGLQIEWFMRASRPLGAQGLPLKGELTLDSPCCDETSELLDAMAEANDPSLGRGDLAAAISDEVAFLDGRLRDALGWLRRTVRADLEAKGRDAGRYLAALQAELSGMTVELYPVASQSSTTRYKPAVHVRETVAAAVAVARRSRPPATRQASPAKAQQPAATRPRKAPAPMRTGRPFRMRRYSALYE